MHCGGFFCPQIRYPDCYGIDMAKLGDFVAFNAAISLLKERGMENLIQEVYRLCQHQLLLPKEEVINAVKRIYEPFSDEEISDRIADLLKPSDLKANLKMVFQKIENVHKACPDHLGIGIFREIILLQVAIKWLTKPLSTGWSNAMNGRIKDMVHYSMCCPALLLH